MEITLSPDWHSPGGTLRHTWSPIGNVDQFRWLSRADLQGQLAMARDELGVRHVRAVAMYSPELCVWDYNLAEWNVPAEQKFKVANWQLVDISIESLLDLGLKPIYTTCFMPTGLTDDPTRCWPDRNMTGMPRDLAQWRKFVANGIRHHIKRFGIDEVLTWYFECWNEANLRGCFFGGTREDFFTLWSTTWQAVKGVDPRLRFGGPSTARAEWLPEFLDFTARDGTPPDYLIAHLYNNDSAEAPLSPFDGPASHAVKGSPHFATGVIRGVRRELDARGFEGEVHWNEWGRSWLPHDPLKETALEAAFVVKTMAETSQDADAFAFWCLSDIYNQLGCQSAEFQGHYGMLSLHGLRKPPWFAHVLLQRLGSESVPVSGGNELCGALATMDGGQLKILVYSYPLEESAKPQPTTVTVKMPEGVEELRLTRLGAVENNIVATWRSMGAPRSPTRAELSRLREENVLRVATVDALRCEVGRVSFEMETPGVAFLEGAGPLA